MTARVSSSRAPRPPEVGAERGELVLAVAGAHAEHRPPVADAVEGGHLLDDVGGVVQAGEVDPGAESDALGVGGDRTQEHERPGLVLDLG
jgi:hypothetical protein